MHWIVEKAEALGLEFDNAFLAHFLPCFNSTLQDSMSAMYRVLGEHVRPIAIESPESGEVHQSALDRMNLASLAYKPPNLIKARTSGAVLKAVDTKRVSRGVPC